LAHVWSGPKLPCDESMKRHTDHVPYCTKMLMPNPQRNNGEGGMRISCEVFVLERRQEAKNSRLLRLSVKFGFLVASRCLQVPFVLVGQGGALWTRLVTNQHLYSCKDKLLGYFILETKCLSLTDSNSLFRDFLLLS
jgi:hypothetical protein